MTENGQRISSSNVAREVLGAVQKPRISRNSSEFLGGFLNSGGRSRGFRWGFLNGTTEFSSKKNSGPQILGPVPIRASNSMWTNSFPHILADGERILPKQTGVPLKQWKKWEK